MLFGRRESVIAPFLTALLWLSLSLAHAAKLTLPELLDCDMLLDVPDRLGPNVRGFFVPIHFPRDGVDSTPVWHSGSAFERAFLMTTEVVRPYLFPHVTPEVLYELERASRQGRGGPRVRVELLGGHAEWSPILRPDPEIESAIGPRSVVEHVSRAFPRSRWIVSRISVFFWKPLGTPPTLIEVAEARGALLIAKRHFGFGRDVTLEVHGIGPLPEKPQLYVDFNIDLGRRPEEVRRERTGPGAKQN